MEPKNVLDTELVVHCLDSRLRGVLGSSAVLDQTGFTPGRLVHSKSMGASVDLFVRNCRLIVTVRTSESKKNDVTRWRKEDTGSLFAVFKFQQEFGLSSRVHGC
jgi:hypothetical protein